MEFKDMSKIFMKVWNNTTLPKLSRGVSKWLIPEEDHAYQFPKFAQYESSSNEQETDGTGRQKVWNNTTLPKLSRGVSKTNCNAVPKTPGKERKDDSNRVVQEKSNCASNEEMNDSVGKNHKVSSLAESKHKKTDSKSRYFAAVCVLLLMNMYLPTGQGAPLGNTPEIYCESYLSNLYDSSGPWNHSMCSWELEKIHCQTGEIRRCVPFISGDSTYYAACIKDPKGYTLKDDECILLTQIGGSNKKVAQCYGKDYCLPRSAATSAPTNLKSNPLTPNATNEPLHSSSNKSTGTYNWTTVLVFLLCYWFIA